ncbi:MAG: exodeoxyribonuclease VII large subunit [Suipraeoptans sp.]
MNNNIYSVKQVNAYIKNMFANDYMLNKIYIKGEVSNCKYHSSGHIYFSLKDESGTIACIMFKGLRSGLAFHMQEGQQVVVMGSVSVYERGGSYQIYAQEIRLDGEGVLYEKFQLLKKELEEMGMFDNSYKKPLPFYPNKIGVVTAKTGAAVRDIINVSKRRNPYIEILLYPAKVQGEGAAQSVSNGIAILNTAGVDVIIVGRGGGSMEDLWAFNEEAVARAIFNSNVPIVSAVGHETDTTIADFVADLRAPTPSAAAELVVPDYRAIESYLIDTKLKMSRNVKRVINIQRLKLSEYNTKIKFLHPRIRLREKQQRLVDTQDRIENLIKTTLNKNKYNLQVYIEKLKGLSPLSKLNQGFSYVSDENGKVIKSISNIKIEDKINIDVTDGKIEAIVNNIRSKENGK